MHSPIVGSRLTQSPVAKSAFSGETTVKLVPEHGTLILLLIGGLTGFLLSSSVDPVPPVTVVA